ncbi:MAG: DUF6034 family protein [Clostridiales bacterium]|nr:DUF6034 family protein [Clostridiales bacterium]
MKRTFTVLLAALLLLPLLAACQPTPKDDFVVNKGDDTLEDKLNATAEPSAPPTEGGETAPNGEPQSFPDRWEMEATEVKEYFTIAANADVVTKADGMYPVYEVRIPPLKHEQMIALVSAFTGKTPASVSEAAMTKADWIREMQAFMEEVEEQRRWIEAGRPDWGDRDGYEMSEEEIKERTEYYMECIANAPETVKTEKVSDYSGLKEGGSIYTFTDGSKAYVYVWASGVKVTQFDGEGFCYYRYEHEEDLKDGEGGGRSRLWHDADITLSEARETLERELARLGFTEHTEAYAFETTLLIYNDSLLRYGSSGWRFRLVWNPAGYPVPQYPYEPSQELNYSNDESSAANAPIGIEALEVFVDAEGIKDIGYSFPREVVGIKNTNVELLPFGKVKERVISSLTMCFPLAARRREYPGEVIPIEIYSMVLTTVTVREKGSGNYFEMPCWVVFFDGPEFLGLENVYSEEQINDFRDRMRNDPELVHGVLLINAVDGSVIFTNR